MTCTVNSIKQLLPAYLHQELDEPGIELVKEHLASCEDCRMELSLLAMLSTEAVPDPGDSFWAEMPTKIELEVRRHRERKRFGLLDLLTCMPALRPAWAAAAVVLTVSALLFFARPVTHDVASNVNQQDESVRWDFGEETLNTAEMSASEVQAVGQWAQNEFRRISRDLQADGPENPEQDISEDISNMNLEELDQLYELLERREHDIREKSSKPNLISAG